MANITVTHQRGSEYVVTVEEGGTSTTHTVTVWPSDVERYAPGSTPEELLEASFDFLLAREPKEAILSRFELPAIESYFPDYRGAIGAAVESLREAT